jgi:hypothetical protein
MTIQWSLSKLSTYEKCGAQYDYKYNQKLPYSTSPSAGRGVQIHSLVESYVKGTVSELPAELGFYKAFLDHVKSYGDRAYPEVRLSVDASWQPVEWDQGWWRGILDLLVMLKDSPTAHIYDWKTGKIYDDHDDQKELYAAAVFSTYPAIREIKTFHVYLDLHKTVPKDFHRDQLNAIQTRWRDKANQLTIEDYSPSPGFYCTWCSYSRRNKGPCKF